MLDSLQCGEKKLHFFKIRSILGKVREIKISLRYIHQIPKFKKMMNYIS